jgi:hypothetical protein
LKSKKIEQRVQYTSEGSNDQAFFKICDVFETGKTDLGKFILFNLASHFFGE